MPRKQESPATDRRDASADGPKWAFEPLDKKSFTPMYFQIQTQLLKMIQTGKLLPGDSLPSEEELSRICGVSRLLYHWTLHVDIDWSGYAERYCYGTRVHAEQALEAWDGSGDPEGWHRHPETGRRRNLTTGEEWVAW